MSQPRQRPACSNRRRARRRSDRYPAPPRSTHAQPRPQRDPRPGLWALPCRPARHRSRASLSPPQEHPLHPWLSRRRRRLRAPPRHQRHPRPRPELVELQLQLRDRLCQARPVLLRLLELPRRRAPPLDRQLPRAPLARRPLQQSRPPSAPPPPPRVRPKACARRRPHRPAACQSPRAAWSRRSRALPHPPRLRSTRAGHSRPARRLPLLLPRLRRQRLPHHLRRPRQRPRPARHPARPRLPAPPAVHRPLLRRAARTPAKPRARRASQADAQARQRSAVRASHRSPRDVTHLPVARPGKQPCSFWRVGSL